MGKRRLFSLILIMFFLSGCGNEKSPKVDNTPKVTSDTVSISSTPMIEEATVAIKPSNLPISATSLPETEIFFPTEIPSSSDENSGLNGRADFLENEEELMLLSDSITENPAEVIRSGFVTEENPYPFSGHICIEDAYIKEEAKYVSKTIAILYNNADVTVIRSIQVDNQEWYEISFEKTGETKTGYIAANAIRPTYQMLVYDVSVSLDDLLYQKQSLPTETIESVPQEGNAVVIYKGYGIYSGSFREGKRSGNGSFIWKNTDRYDGEWAQDRITGKGKLIWADGSVYEGRFYGGKLIEGTITVTTEDKRVFEFLYFDDTVNGHKCILTWPDGTTITGKFSKTTFIGEVTITYSSGDEYVGTLKDGKKSGNGVYTWKNGSSYKGNWENDQMNGNGIYYFSSEKRGNYLQGKFKDNQPDGVIVYVGDNGLRYNTTWNNGVCTSIEIKK